MRMWAREDSNFRPLPCQRGQGHFAASLSTSVIDSLAARLVQFWATRHFQGQNGPLHVSMPYHDPAILISEASPFRPAAELFGRNAAWEIGQDFCFEFRR